MVTARNFVTKELLIMFEHRKKPPLEPLALKAPTIEGVDIKTVNDFLALYIKVVNGASWNNEQIAKGVDISKDLPRFKTIEAKMDKAWDALTLRAQAEAVRELVKNGYLAKDTFELLAQVGGRVTSVSAISIEEHRAIKAPAGLMPKKGKKDG
jgi:hypothetical protein